MSILHVNPTGGNGTMIVRLEGVKPRHANRIEEAAFRHGKSGVGHTYFNPEQVAVDGNLRIWRKPRKSDPGQPKGWDLLAPFDTGGLAGHIRALCRLLGDDPAFVQALVFQSADEGLAFQAELLGGNP